MSIAASAEKLTKPTPNHFAAARLTIGVSSEASVVNERLSSSLSCEDILEYTGENKAAEDVLEVNHSPRERRFSNGI